MQLSQTTQLIHEKEISFFTMKSPSGMAATVCSLGAALTGLSVPDRNGQLANVTLSFADPAQYMGNPFYAGAVLGPNAGRLSGSVLSIDGQLWRLSANDGRNNLHGGRQNVSFANWSVLDSVTGEEEACVLLETALADGVDGFPGNRRIRAAYRLDRNGGLTLTLSAVSDKKTYVNLSSHAYFNLTGDFTGNADRASAGDSEEAFARDSAKAFDGDFPSISVGTCAQSPKAIQPPALRQQLQILADCYIANDGSHLPRAILPVQNSPFDFRDRTAPGAQMQRYPDDAQLKNANGYNNGFVLRRSPADSGVSRQGPDTGSGSSPIFPAAVLSDPQSGRKMTLLTDAPCLVLYSGGYLEGGPLILDRNKQAVPPANACALALEAQDFPDAPQNPLFDCQFLSPGQEWRRTIRWEFSLL